MKRLIRAGKVAFMALAALASVLAVDAPSEAHAMGGHGFAGGHGGGGAAHQGFDGHHSDGHHFDGHFDRGVHGRARFGFGAVVPYYGYYPYYGAPAYWYYCPSYGAYYPNVESCPEAWVPVPAS
jgi:hypothetical protein